MSRLAVGVMLVSLAVAALGYPTGLDDVASAAAAGDWKRVSEILSSFYRARFDPQFKAAGLQAFPTDLQGFGTSDVRSLKPQEGGHVYAEAAYDYQASTNDNGKVHQISGGRKIINQDGKITEIDYKPEPQIY